MTNFGTPGAPPPATFPWAQLQEEGSDTADGYFRFDSNRYMLHSGGVFSFGVDNHVHSTEGLVFLSGYIFAWQSGGGGSWPITGAEFSVGALNPDGVESSFKIGGVSAVPNGTSEFLAHLSGFVHVGQPGPLRLTWTGPGNVGYTLRMALAHLGSSGPIDEDF